MGEIIRKRAPLWIFIFHELQQRIRHNGIRRIIQGLISLPFRKKANDIVDEGKLEQLRQDGFLFVESGLTTDEIDSLIQNLKSKKCVDRARPQLGVFAIDGVPKGTHVADINDIVDIPEAIKLANNPAILNLVSGYLGCEPVVDNIKAWWSLPGFDNAENEQFYHRDNDTVGFIKLFIYLSNVTEKDGPHVFIRGSHASSGFMERRRYTDKEVENSVPSSDVVRYVGPVGTCFLEDTWGVHKGALPEQDIRLLLQVRYSILPTIFLSKFGTKNVDCRKAMRPGRLNKFIAAK